MPHPVYKGQTCAYCATDGSSEAPDHIFARGFFPIEERDRLPCVPSCDPCNRQKAALENYLVTILPFGGESDASGKMLREAVPRRLENNKKLHRQISQGRSRVWVNRGDMILPSLAVPIDAERLNSLFAMIAKGLVAYHWNIVIPSGHVSRAGMFTQTGERLVRNLFKSHTPAAVVQGRLGADTFLYEGIQAHDDPFFTIWRFRIYGGLTVAGDPNCPSETGSDVWAMTSRPEVPSLFDLDDDHQSTLES